MSHNFCCDIWMVESEVCVNNMKTRVHPALYDCVWDIFWSHFGILSTKQHFFNTTAYLNIVADRVHPFQTCSDDLKLAS